MELAGVGGSTVFVGGIAADGDGNVYVTGNGAGGFSIAGLIDCDEGGFFAALNDRGIPQWCIALGDTVIGTAVAAAPDGGVAVTGTYAESVTFGVSDQLLAGPTVMGMFVAFFDPAGGYVRLCGGAPAGGLGPQTVQPNAIVVAADGEPRVGASFTGNFLGRVAQSSDALLVPWWAEAPCRAGTFPDLISFGGQDPDSILAIAVDSGDRSIVAGVAGGGMVLNREPFGGMDGLVAAYASQATDPEWAVRLGTAEDDSAFGVALDGDDRIYLALSEGGQAYAEVRSRTGDYAAGRSFSRAADELDTAAAIGVDPADDAAIVVGTYGPTAERTPGLFIERWVPWDDFRP